MPVIVKPYYLFGGEGYSYRSAHFSVEEADAEAARLGLATWRVYVYQDEGLALVARVETEVETSKKKSKTT